MQLLSGASNMMHTWGEVDLWSHSVLLPLQTAVSQTLALHFLSQSQRSLLLQVVVATCLGCLATLVPRTTGYPSFWTQFLCFLGRWGCHQSVHGATVCTLSLEWFWFCSAQIETTSLDPWSSTVLWCCQPSSDSHQLADPSRLLSATPTSWTIGHIVPTHARQIHQSLGMGLGVNTMEGREAKHIALAKFTRNTQFSNRWLQVFRHEYVSLVWLRENGCDENVHKETSGVYIPKRCYSDQFCHCGQPKQAHNGKKCSFSAQLRRVVSECVIQRKITNGAKAVYN